MEYKIVVGNDEDKITRAHFYNNKIINNYSDNRFSML